MPNQLATICYCALHSVRGLTNSVGNVPIKLTHQGWYFHLFLRLTCTGETFLSSLRPFYIQYLYVQDVTDMGHPLDLLQVPLMNSVGICIMRVQLAKGISKPWRTWPAQDPENQNYTVWAVTKHFSTTENCHAKHKYLCNFGSVNTIFLKNWKP